MRILLLEILGNLELYGTIIFATPDNMYGQFDDEEYKMQSIELHARNIALFGKELMKISFSEFVYFGLLCFKRSLFEFVFLTFWNFRKWFWNQIGHFWGHQFSVCFQFKPYL